MDPAFQAFLGLTGLLVVGMIIIFAASYKWLIIPQQKDHAIRWAKLKQQWDGRRKTSYKENVEELKKLAK